MATQSTDLNSKLAALVKSRPEVVDEKTDATSKPISAQDAKYRTLVHIYIKETGDDLEGTCEILGWIWLPSKPGHDPKRQDMILGANDHTSLQDENNGRGRLVIEHHHDSTVRPSNFQTVCAELPDNDDEHIRSIVDLDVDWSADANMKMADGRWWFRTREEIPGYKASIWFKVTRI